MYLANHDRLTPPTSTAAPSGTASQPTSSTASTPGFSTAPAAGAVTTPSAMTGAPDAAPPTPTVTTLTYSTYTAAPTAAASHPPPSTTTKTDTTTRTSTTPTSSMTANVNGGPATSFKKNTALFPSPRLGEVESEGAAASTRDVIKVPAYHASQDAAGNAASLAEGGARDDVDVVHSAQGKPSFPLIGPSCVSYL